MKKTDFPGLMKLLNNRRFPKTVIALFVFINLFCCAKQGFPPGGEEDKRAPFVIRTTPGLGETNVVSDNTVVIEFSESMNTESVDQNLFIVPLPQEWPGYEWKSKNRVLNIKFKKPFRENTTYVLTLGAKALDLHNNMMKKSFVLSFSTGDKIENRRISGRVIPNNFFEEKKDDTAGVDVIAYIVKSDSVRPDPRKDVPDFFTQTGSDGYYEMMGLSAGRFILFAVGDRDKNGFYSEGSDMIGICAKDIVIAMGDSIKQAPDIVVTRPDTSAVQLFSVKSPDSHRVDITFSRPVLSDSFRVAIKGLDVSGWFIPKSSPSVVSVATGKQEKGTKYTLESIYCIDTDGNRFENISLAPPFDGSDKADTTKLAITEKIPGVMVPGESTLSLVFNRVLDLTGDPEGLISHNSLTPLSVVKTKSNVLEITTDWKGGDTYNLKFDTEKLKSTAGNSFDGPASQLNFRVVSADTLGYIQGTLKDDDIKENSGYNLILKNLDSGIFKNIAIKGNGDWSTGPVLPGKYIFICFRDEDGDGKLFNGSIHPFRFSEKVVACSDTIDVASRWTNEGNAVIFK